MSKAWTTIKKRWKQYWCKHLFYIEDMHQVPFINQYGEEDRTIRCRCAKCHKLHEAPYGLALPGKIQYRSR